jgi:hypothetical protein
MRQIIQGGPEYEISEGMALQNHRQNTRSIGEGRHAGIVD